MYRLTLAAAVVTVVPGQQKVPVPEPFLTAEIPGPAALHDVLRVTEIGRLLGAAVAPPALASRLIELALPWVRSGEAPVIAATAPALDLFSGFRGRIRIRLLHNGETGKVAAIVELLSDGRTDPEGLSEELNRFLTATVRGRSQREVGGRTLTILGRAGSSTLSFVQRNRVVVLFGDVLRAGELVDAVVGAAPVVSSALAGAPIWAVDRVTWDYKEPAPDSWTAEVKMDMISALLKQLLWNASNIRSIELAVRPRDSRLQVDVAIRKIDPAHQGVLGMLFGSFEPDAEPWPFPKDTRCSVLGVSYEPLTESLLGPMLLQDPVEPLVADLRPGVGILGDWPSGCCLLFRVVDGKVVERTIHEQLHVGDTTASRHGGVEIRSGATDFETTCHTAIHDRRLLVAFGDQGLKLLRAALETKSDRADRVLHPLLRAKAARPPGCNGYGILGPRTVVGMILPVIVDMCQVKGRPRFTPEWDTMSEAVRRLEPVLKKHGLSDVVWFSGRDERLLYARFLW